MSSSHCGDQSTLTFSDQDSTVRSNSIVYVDLELSENEQAHYIKAKLATSVDRDRSEAYHRNPNTPSIRGHGKRRLNMQRD